MPTTSYGTGSTLCCAASPKPWLLKKSSLHLKRYRITLELKQSESNQMASLQKHLWQLQHMIETTLWPFPGSSDVALSFRDVFFTTLIFVAFVAILKTAGLQIAVGALLFAAYTDPAILAFPFNVAQGLVLRTPRFWNMHAVEPRLVPLASPDMFQLIRREVMTIVKDPTVEKPFFADVSPHQRNIASNQPWTVFPFWAYETVNHANCARAPRLTNFLKQIPTVRLAMLSIMSKGAHIPTHCGYFKSVLRVHLTLHTDVQDTFDNPKRFIDVGGETYSWAEGELVAFDDTYPHSVTNDVEGLRVVLFLDVDRPYSSTFAKTCSDLLLKLMRNSPSVRKHAALQERNHIRS